MSTLILYNKKPYHTHVDLDPIPVMALAHGEEYVAEV